MYNLYLLRTTWILSPLIMIGCLLFYPLHMIPWVWGLLFAISCQFFGQGIGLHRYFCHRGFKTYPIVDLLLTLYSIPTALGSPLSWSALHRQHHNTSDTDEDFISPHKRSWASIYFSTYLGTTVGLPSIRDFTKSKLQMFVHRHYMLLFAVWVSLVLGLGGWPAVVAFVFLPVTWVYNVTMLGTIAVHTWGYRNHNTNDKSVNSILVAIFTLGDGWHNNHHANSTKYKHGERWFEIDPHALVIKAIARP